MAIDTVPETWRPVAGFEGLYSVSSLGAVRQDNRMRIKRPTPNAKGYLRLGIYSDGVRFMVRVSRVVAIAFIGPPPSSSHQVNHKNGVKTDNRACNLEWVTGKENSQHAWASGLCEGVREIFKRKRKGRTPSLFPPTLGG